MMLGKELEIELTENWHFERVRKMASVPKG